MGNEASTLFHVKGKPPEFGNLEQIEEIKKQLREAGAVQMCEIDEETPVEKLEEIEIEFETEKKVEVSRTCPLCQTVNSDDYVYGDDTIEKCYGNMRKCPVKVNINVDYSGDVEITLVTMTASPAPAPQTLAL